MSTQILSNKLTRLNTLFAMVITTLFAVQAHAMFGFEPYYKFGAVYTRSIVVDPSTNMPIWVEYDETGREAGVIGGMQDGDFTFSGTEYRAYHDQYTQIMEDMPDAIWMSVYDYLAQAEYLAYNDETFSPVEINPDYDNVQFVLVRSKEQTQIADGEYHLLARFPVDVRQPVGGDYASLLLRTDPASGAVSSIITPAEPDYNIGFRVKFFGPEGDDTGEEALDGVDTTTINYRKATDVIYGPIKGARITTTPAARITDGAETGEDGKYTMHYTLPPCPGFTFSYTTPAYLELQYNRFNPRLPGYRIYWQQRLDYDFCNGLAATAPPLIRSAVIGILATAATPIKRPRDFPIDIMVLNGHARLENPDGSGVDVTPELTDIQSVFALDNFSKSATPPTYDLSVPSFVRQTQSYYDFDKDGEYETTVLGRVVEVPVEGGEEGETEKLFFPQTDQDYPCVTSRDEQGELCSHQGVYLSSTGNLPAEAQPDILRIADWGLSDDSEFQDKGLATEMGEIDLSNTDLYIFRESNGELIAERRGLNTSEANASTKGLQGAADGRFFYTLEMRGPREGIYSASYLRRNPRDPVTGNPVGPQNAYRFWQQQSGVVEKFWNREADHLRPGERIRIIAINRVTGYMGSVTTELKAHSNTDTDDNGDTIERNAMMIDYSVNDIVMRPPNLKVWAERSYTVEQGLTRGTQYLGDDARDPTDDSQKAAPVIGFEGAGLGTDTAIVVYTEWLDQDGRALPEALGDYGYTARFAKIVAPNQLDDAAVGQADDGSGAVAQFPIKPGKHTSVIRFSNPNSNREHLYIHVSGQPFTRQADFEQLQVFQTTDASTGMQESRPDRYVPIKVPVYNEDESLQAQKTYRDYVEAQGEDADITTPKPEPIYEWLYRPEFQFSVYDLTVQEIRRQVSEDDVEDIYSAETPVIASSDELITFAYNLLSRDINSDGLDNDTLNAFSYDGERELVIALGEEEVLATIGSDQTITFENLGALALLDPEDFLSMRLYSNNDAANILWEWAFEYLWLEPLYAGFDNQADSYFFISADDPVVPLEAVLVGYADRAPESKETITVVWRNDGEGSLSSILQSDDDQGIFDNELTLPTTAGSESTVSINMYGLSDSVHAKLKTFKVVPGEPDQITVLKTGETSLGGHGEVELTYTIRDKNGEGNLVADGTGVAFTLDDSLQLVSADTETLNGQAKAVVKGGHTDGVASITLQAGTVELTSQVTINPLVVTINGGLATYSPGEKVTATISVTDLNNVPVPNAELTITATYAFLKESNIVTNEQGLATVELTMPEVAGQGSLTASVGFQYVELGTFNVQYQNEGARPFEAGNAVVIGDVATDGFIQHERYDGEMFQVDYNVSTEVTVKGQENDSVDVVLGDIHDPNIPALVFMGDLYNGTVADKTGNLTLEAENVETSFDTAIGAGTSYRFMAGNQSLLKTDEIDRLSLDGNLGVSFEFKPVFGGATLVNLRNGAFEIKFNPSGTLTFSIETLQGSFSITTSEPAYYNQWHKVAARYQNGQIELWLNDNQYFAPAQGNIGETDPNTAPEIVSGSQLEIGNNFSGNIARIKWFDWSAGPLLTFSDLSTSGSFIVSSSGETKVAVVSAGRLHDNNSQLDIQRVAITGGDIRQYVSLVSEEAFNGIAGMYVDVLATDVPPINIAGLDPHYQSPYRQYGSLFPQAYALSFSEFAWGAVNFLLPIEDVKIIYEQIDKLLFGKPGDFEPAEFIIAAINVFTVLPPAKPLKLLTKPASKFIRAMKAINPKFLTSMGGVFTKVLHQARRLNFDLLLQSLPFVVIAAEVYLDDESREGLIALVESITSTEDATAIIEYLALPSEGWEGEGLGIVDAFGGGEGESTSLPFTGLFPQAYAASPRLNINIIKKTMKEFKRIYKTGEIKDLPGGLRAIKEVLKDANTGPIRGLVHKEYLVRLATSSVSRSFSNAFQVLMKGEKFTRISRPAMIGTVAYLTWETTCGKLIDLNESETAAELQCGGRGFDARLRSVYHRKLIAAFADSANKVLTEENERDVVTEEESANSELARQTKIAGYDQSGHGALFHLHELAKYQLLTRAGAAAGFNYYLDSSEVYRVVGFYKSTGDRQDAIDGGLTDKYIKRIRWVDIVLKDSGGNEHWIELKSLRSASESNTKALAGSSLLPWTIKNQNTGGADQGSSYHRQVTLDRVAAKTGIAWLAKNGADEYDTYVPVSSFQWIFQKFKRNNERSPVLGIVRDKKSISGKLAADAKIVKGDKLEYSLGNPPGNTNFSLSGFEQVKDLLIQRGFDIAENADDILVGLDD